MTIEWKVVGGVDGEFNQELGLTSDTLGILTLHLVARSFGRIMTMDMFMFILNR